MKQKVWELTLDAIGKSVALYVCVFFVCLLVCLFARPHLIVFQGNDVFKSKSTH